MNADELELLIDVKEAKVNEFLQIVSKKRKIPLEILESVYAHCIRYPEIKMMAKDAEVKKIWTRKYAKNEELKNSFDIIHSDTIEIKKE
jgi:hypothetical protein